MWPTSFLPSHPTLLKNHRLNENTSSSTANLCKRGLVASKETLEDNRYNLEGKDLTYKQSNENYCLRVLDQWLRDSLNEGLPDKIEINTTKSNKVGIDNVNYNIENITLNHILGPTSNSKPTLINLSKLMKLRKEILASPRSTQSIIDSVMSLKEISGGSKDDIEIEQMRGRNIIPILQTMNRYNELIQKFNEITKNKTTKFFGGDDNKKIEKNNDIMLNFTIICSGKEDPNLKNNFGFSFFSTETKNLRKDVKAVKAVKDVKVFDFLQGTQWAYQSLTNKEARSFFRKLKLTESPFAEENQGPYETGSYRDLELQAENLMKYETQQPSEEEKDTNNTKKHPKKFFLLTANFQTHEKKEGKKI
jgi:hypothetical protein